MEHRAVVTDKGNEKIALALESGQSVVINKFAAGDGGGKACEVSKAKTSLVNQVWMGELKSYERKGNALIAEAAIPAENGGFTVREIGIFDTDGDLIAYANTPDTYKEAGGDVINILELAISIKVDNTEAVTFEVNTDHTHYVFDNDVKVNGKVEVTGDLCIAALQAHIRL